MMINKTVLGISAGVLAGALWGLVFLVPQLIRGFTPMQLSAGRYVAYGIVSAILIARSWHSIAAKLSAKEWRALVWLSLTGNIIYYILLAAAVQTGGVAMAALVIGLLPVVVTLVAGRDDGAVSFRQLIPSLILSSAGLICISWKTLSATGTGSLSSLLYAIGALISWTVYAVENSRWLAQLKNITSHEWSLLTGLVTGAQALLLLIPSFCIGPSTHSATDWMHFSVVVTGIALFCSILGNALWNHASRMLPLTLVGQMIVFETLFAATYGFLWEKRWPTLAEYSAMGLLIAGVILCASVHSTKK
jgi:drug/metabolite transporter (DMT)-like permease